MKLFKQTILVISIILVSLFLSLSSAQTNNPIVGTWQTSIPLGQGMPNAVGIFKVEANGTYREEMYVNDQLSAYWEGQYTLSPQGQLIQYESNKSPQICAMNQCFANEGPSQTMSQLSMQSADAFIAMLQDPQTGQTISINWQRINANTQQPQMPQQPTLSQPQMPQQGNQIVGKWQAQERTNAGHTVTHLFNYSADGRFQYQRIINGQSLMSSYSGTYSLDANGNYTETATDKSAQFCYLQCQPNPVQLHTPNYGQINFPNPNNMIYAGINFQRANNQTPQVNQPGYNPQQPADLNNQTGGWNTPTWNDTTNSGSTSWNNDTSVTGLDPFNTSVIWEESPYTDPTTGDIFTLPNSPDPYTTYTSPNGNDLNYNDTTGVWTETDAWGFETEVEQSDW